MADARERVSSQRSNGSTNDPADEDDLPREITLEDALLSGPDLIPMHRTDDAFKDVIQSSYNDDPFFKVIMGDPTANRSFHIKEGFVWMMNAKGDEVLCLPKGIHNGHTIQEIVLDQAHKVLGHFGYQRTSEYVRRWYWWLRIVSDAKDFCKTCPSCQQAKGGNKQPTGKLHTLPIPTKPWDSIGMDFIGPFPELEIDGRKFNYLWVVVCRLTSMVHLIPVHTTMSACYGFHLSVDLVHESTHAHTRPSRSSQ